MWLRKRVVELEKYVRVLGDEDARQETEILRLKCGQTGHNFTAWKRDYFIEATCSCGFTKLATISELKPAEIKALLELGILSKSDLPKPKPRKKGRRS